MITDVVIGAQFGDEAKGKVVNHLLGQRTYDLCLRFNGGGNAGHTIYHKGKKFVTHHLPGGVFHGIKSVIGPGCVLNIENFFKEVEQLKAGGVDVGKLMVARNVHIIQEEHLHEDGKDTRIGTTRTGNGPAYRDKVARLGLRAEEVPELKPYLVDMYDLFYNGNIRNVLAEGAQGFYLDIDWGSYPYVTSSNVGVGAVVNNGIPIQSICDVFCAAKAYETYVGAKAFQPAGDKVLTQIQHVGNEYGATTGRPRECNYLHLPRLKKALEMNSALHLIISKMDILQEVGVWRLFGNDGSLMEFSNEDEFKTYINLCLNIPGLQIQYSYSPEKI